jgi:hypothetical protein
VERDEAREHLDDANEQATAVPVVGRGEQAARGQEIEDGRRPAHSAMFRTIETLARSS